MNRRTALQIVSLTALSAGIDAWGVAADARGERVVAWTAGDYRLQFFTPAENELLDQLMEMIIPADAQSGGAHAAKVSLLADLLVATGSDAGKNEWRQGLQLFREEAARSSVAATLARAAAGEAHSQSDLERFFVTLKQMTVNGYYSSEIGIHQDLRYQGNTYMAEFPGCT